MKKFLRLFIQEDRWKKASDEELLRAYRQTGKQELAAELFNRYVHLIYGLCGKYLKDKEKCRDVVMAVFEQVIIQAKVTEIQHFSKWLYTTAKNHCISTLRVEQRLHRQQEEWKKNEKSGSRFMENEGFVRLNSKGTNESDASHILHEAISELEDGQRTCIRLFFFEKKSYKEIAGATGYSIKQVKSYLQNGKRRLGIMIGEKYQKSQ